MLVLSRRPGESIVIDLGNGQRVTITHIDVKHDRARIGIEAPKEVTVDREEVRQKKRNQL
jgi:carbon storage regulator